MISLIECSVCKKQIAYSAANCPDCGAENKWVHPKFIAFKEALKQMDLPEFTYRTTRTTLDATLKKPRSIDSGTAFIRFVGVLIGLIIWEVSLGWLKTTQGGILILSAGEIVLLVGMGYYFVMALIKLLKEIFTPIEDSINEWKNYDKIYIDYSENLETPKVTCNNDEVWKPVRDFFTNGK
ncbi:hypothetical protein [Bdellovibrio sp. KM01]|uniref:hypothetical protein n=1 Tax=Bdellovibrio sp. KM01 TaxID=2748865 RepID=UPI0015E9F005|nr:hypothetical protein [Bdellovibrio sp. KM01]QLY24895.1 hypothetical protein HW988_15905 [Bdellovibrio sp. KM01]